MKTSLSRNIKLIRKYACSIQNFVDWEGEVVVLKYVNEKLHTFPTVEMKGKIYIRRRVTITNNHVYIII